MAQAAIMSKAELLHEIKVLLPGLATEKKSKGWDIVLESWDDDTIVKAMGRSTKLPGAIWAIEWRLTELVNMRNEAKAEDAHEADMLELLDANGGGDDDEGAADAAVADVNDEELAAAD